MNCKAVAVSEFNTWIEELSELHEANGPAKPKTLPLIDITKWQGCAPDRRSLWGDWLPLHQTTLLTGAGGVGKSLFDQMLCTAVALGKPFLGMDTTQRNALYVTCEDDSDELWRRQDAICDRFGVTREDLIGKLFLSSLSGELETAIAVDDGAGGIKKTERWSELVATCREHSIGLYAFDNATDALAADHNLIHPVAAFVNLLTGLAIEQDGVAMVLHHPNKAGDDWLGSVAWHNKVRSRLIIKRGNADLDPDCRTISNPKANYGPSGGAIDFRWHEGAFVREQDLPADYAKQLQQSVKASGENAAFLACLRARAEQGEGRHVGPNSGPNYAPSQFEGMPEAKGLDRKALKAAMDRLFSIGAIETETYHNKAKGREITIIQEASQTSPNAFPNASRTHFPNDPKQSTRTTPRTHLPLQGEEGVAPNGPAPLDNDAGWIGESPAQTSARLAARS